MKLLICRLELVTYQTLGYKIAGLQAMNHIAMFAIWSPLLMYNC